MISFSQLRFLRNRPPETDRKKFLYSILFLDLFLKILLDAVETKSKRREIKKGNEEEARLSSFFFFFILSGFDLVFYAARVASKKGNISRVKGPGPFDGSMDFVSCLLPGGNVAASATPRPSPAPGALLLPNKKKSPKKNEVRTWKGHQQSLSHTHTHTHTHWTEGSGH